MATATARPTLVIRPLTPDLWPALEDLFGPNGACNGCWCMYPRIGTDYRKRPREKNRAAFRRIVKEGPPPGLLAFAPSDGGEVAVGWCQLTPRSSLPWFDTSSRLKRVDDAPVWSISCFFIRRGHRRKGVSGALIKAALQMAKAAKAPALEAYPVDSDISATTSYTGYASSFARAGFDVVARPHPARPIMRHALGRRRKPAAPAV
jgi:GNAT superfamily N-acetyltransferase